MAAPTVTTLLFPSKTQEFHLFRPVYALGTFPSRGRLGDALSLLVVQFFDSLRLFALYLLPEQAVLSSVEIEPAVAPVGQQSCPGRLKTGPPWAAP